MLVICTGLGLSYYTDERSFSLVYTVSSQKAKISEFGLVSVQAGQEQQTVSCLHGSRRNFVEWLARVSACSQEKSVTLILPCTACKRASDAWKRRNRCRSPWVSVTFRMTYSSPHNYRLFISKPAFCLCEGLPARNAQCYGALYGKVKIAVSCVEHSS